MRNLLSQQDKKTLSREYKLRMTIASMILIFFTMLIAAALLLPSYIVSDYKQKTTHTHSEIIKKSIEAREKSVSNTILNDTKTKLQLLSLDIVKKSLKEGFETIVDKKTEGVKIRELFYEKKSEDSGEILILGEASGREELLQFRRNLEKEEIFLSVVLPVSNLASDTDIDFSINVTGNF